MTNDPIGPDRDSPATQARAIRLLLETIDGDETRADQVLDEEPNDLSPRMRAIRQIERNRTRRELGGQPRPPRRPQRAASRTAPHPGRGMGAPRHGRLCVVGPQVRRGRKQGGMNPRGWAAIL